MSPLSPTVSCIVTGFNQQRFISEAIRSVLRQTYSDFELIFVDDGSTDDTVRSVRSFSGDSRLRIIEGEHLGLPAVTRNRGIDHASGSLLAFLDGDDLWLPEKLAAQVAPLADASVAAVGAAINKFGPGMIARDVRHGPDELLRAVDLIRGGTVALSSLMIRNDGTRFSENPGFRFVEDYDLQLGLAASGNPILKLGRPLVRYRVHPGGGGRSVDAMLRATEVVKKYSELVGPENAAAASYRHLLAASVASIHADDSRRHTLSRRAQQLASSPREKLGASVVRLLALAPQRLRKTVVAEYYRRC